MVLDHANIPVSDVTASETFYTSVLASLGLGIVARDADAVGWGIDSWAFGIVPATQTIDPLHLAFAAPSRAAVAAFHTAGIAAGGADNGAPGLRPDYGSNYFAAYLLDRDGHNIEAVCRTADT